MSDAEESVDDTAAEIHSVVPSIISSDTFPISGVSETETSKSSRKITASGNSNSYPNISTASSTVIEATTVSEKEILKPNVPTIDKDSFEQVKNIKPAISPISTNSECFSDEDERAMNRSCDELEAETSKIPDGDQSFGAETSKTTNYGDQSFDAFEEVTKVCEPIVPTVVDVRQHFSSVNADVASNDFSVENVSGDQDPLPADDINSIASPEEIISDESVAYEEQQGVKCLVDTSSENMSVLSESSVCDQSLLCRPFSIKLTQIHVSEAKVQDALADVAKLESLVTTNLFPGYSSADPLALQDKKCFRCSECLQRFYGIAEVSIHSEKYHGIPLSEKAKEALYISCSSCHSKFSHYSSLPRHNCVNSQNNSVKRRHSLAFESAHLADTGSKCRKIIVDNKLVSHEKSATRYVCHICSQGYLHEQLLKRHLIRIHQVKPTPELLKPSNRSKIGKPFCTVCNLSFARWDAFHIHNKSSVHIEKSAQVSQLIPNTNTHTQVVKISATGKSPLRYACAVCRKSFSKRIYVVRHIKASHETTSKNSLFRTVKSRSQLGGKKSFCTNCKKCFGAQGLRSHMKSCLARTTVHKQSHCVGSPSLTSVLTSKVHTTKNPNADTVSKCHMCGKTMKSCYVGKHLQKVHKTTSEVIPLLAYKRSEVVVCKPICVYCGATPTTYKGLYRHMEKHHVKYWKQSSKTRSSLLSCTDCPLLFQDNYQLENHTKANQCVPMSNSSQISQSRSTTHEDSVVAERCPTDIHKDLVFPCVVCNKMCGTRRTLRRHMISIHNLSPETQRTMMSDGVPQTSVKEPTNPKCTHCHMSFKTWRLFYIHLRRGCGSKQIVVPRSRNSQKTLNKCKAEPINSSDITCSLCDAKFTQVQIWYKHLRQIHRLAESKALAMRDNFVRENQVLSKHLEDTSANQSSTTAGDKAAVSTDIELAICEKCNWTAATFIQLRKHCVIKHPGVKFPTALQKWIASLKSVRSRHKANLPATPIVGKSNESIVLNKRKSLKVSKNRRPNSKKRSFNHSCMLCPFISSYQNNLYRHYEKVHKKSRTDLSKEDSILCSGETKDIAIDELGRDMLLENRGINSSVDETIHTTQQAEHVYDSDTSSGSDWMAIPTDVEPSSSDSSTDTDPCEDDVREDKELLETIPAKRTRLPSSTGSSSSGESTQSNVHSAALIGEGVSSSSETDDPCDISPMAKVTSVDKNMELIISDEPEVRLSQTSMSTAIETGARSFNFPDKDDVRMALKTSKDIEHKFDVKNMATELQAVSGETGDTHVKNNNTNIAVDFASRDTTVRTSASVYVAQSNRIPASTSDSKPCRIESKEVQKKNPPVAVLRPFSDNILSEIKTVTSPQPITTENCTVAPTHSTVSTLQSFPSTSNTEIVSSSRAFIPNTELSTSSSFASSKISTEFSLPIYQVNTGDYVVPCYTGHRYAFQRIAATIIDDKVTWKFGEWYKDLSKCAWRIVAVVNKPLLYMDQIEQLIQALWRNQTNTSDAESVLVPKVLPRFNYSDNKTVAQVTAVTNFYTALHSLICCLCGLLIQSFKELCSHGSVGHPVCGHCHELITAPHTCGLKEDPTNTHKVVKFVPLSTIASHSCKFITVAPGAAEFSKDRSMDNSKQKAIKTSLEGPFKKIALRPKISGSQATGNNQISSTLPTTDAANVPKYLPTCPITHVVQNTSAAIAPKPFSSELIAHVVQNTTADIVPKPFSSEPIAHVVQNTSAADVPKAFSSGPIAHVVQSATADIVPKPFSSEPIAHVVQNTSAANVPKALLSDPIADVVQNTAAADVSKALSSDSSFGGAQDASNKSPIIAASAMQPHKCEFCYLDFPIDIQYKHHMDTLHMTCMICNEKFENRGRRSDHMVSAHQRYMCLACDKTCDSRDDVRKHILSAHVNATTGLFICMQCPDSKISPANIVEHLEEHDVKNNKQCSLCSKSLIGANPVSHVCHFLSHSTQNCSSFCLVCSKMFVAPWALRQHFASHSKPIHFCNYCLHSSQHSGAFDHNNCGATSSVHKDVVTASQMWLASNTSKTSCTLCWESFGLFSELRAHCDTAHKEEAHQCAICGQRFSYAHQLSFHMQKHKKSIRCRYEICLSCYCFTMTKHRTADKEHVVFVPVNACSDCALLNRKKKIDSLLAQTNVDKLRTLAPNILDPCDSGGESSPLPNPASGDLSESVNVTKSLPAPEFLTCSFCDFRCKLRIAMNKHQRVKHAGQEPPENTNTK